MKIDVVVVTFNSEKWLPGCVKALAQADYPLSDITLLFVDNASQDASVSLLAQLKKQYTSFAGFEVIGQTENTGFSKGCNMGAAAGKAEYILFLNADTEVKPGFFTGLAGAVAQAGPDVAAFEARQLPYETGHHINPVTMETSWASGAALLVRRDVFSLLGGFDEHLFMYCEDVDLSWRIRAAGYKIQYVPTAEVSHYAYEGEESPEMKLGEYAGGFYGNLLLRYKYGTAAQIWQGHTMYWGALRRPRHFPHVRKVLAKNYIKHWGRLWPFLFWRFQNRELFNAATSRFEGGFSPDRGLFYLEKPKNSPLVSVIVRTCGRPQVLRETLTSLQHQTYHNFEAVVVEDGPDASRAMLEKEFADKLNLRYFSTGIPVGRSKAGNKGLLEAKGEYCNFLDDDDFFYPDHLELLVSQAEKHPEADLIAASSMAMEATVVSKNPYVLQVGEVYPMQFDRMDLFGLCQQCLMPIQSVLFKRWLFEEQGGLNENLDGDEDWSMWLKYFSVAKRIHKTRVDIPRATSIFVVPANRDEARRREEGYRRYENEMLDDSAVKFTVTPREMREYYEGMLADIRHLKQIGELDGFLERENNRSEELAKAKSQEQDKVNE